MCDIGGGYYSFIGYIRFKVFRMLVKFASYIKSYGCAFIIEMWDGYVFDEYNKVFKEDCCIKYMHIILYIRLRK